MAHSFRLTWAGKIYNPDPRSHFALAFILTRVLYQPLRLLRDIALSFHLIPYLWGGDDFSGLDCSGLIIEILKTAGAAPPNDMTAQQLYGYFAHNGSGLAEPETGALAFYGSSEEHVTHCAFLLDERRMIEAGGGGPQVRDVESAVKRNAFVKIRPFRRSELVGLFLPDYPCVFK